MADFLKAFVITLGNEGGYSNNPSDAGGETYAGISRKFNPNWEGWKIVDRSKVNGQFKPTVSDKALLDIAVQYFYKNNYWDTIRLSEVNNQDIANELFDTSVNMGSTTGIKLIQEACNLLNNEGKLYPDIDVDGKIGPKTLSTINSHPYPVTLFNLLNILQGEKYVNICRAKPSQEVFMRGWLNRRVITKQI